VLVVIDGPLEIDGGLLIGLEGKDVVVLLFVTALGRIDTLGIVLGSFDGFILGISVTVAFVGFKLGRILGTALGP